MRPNRYSRVNRHLRKLREGERLRRAMPDAGINRYYGFEAMPVTVRLNDIVEALEMQFDESPSFLDRETGEVETISQDLLREAEDPDADEELDTTEEQDPEWEIAKLIVSTDRFLRLPSKFDVHEWAIMQDFAQSVKSNKIRADLLHAIHGAGAFRNFKYIIRRDGIEKV
jgi:hypothetical protein